MRSEEGRKRLKGEESEGKEGKTRQGKEGERLEGEETDEAWLLRKKEESKLVEKSRQLPGAAQSPSAALPYGLALEESAFFRTLTLCQSLLLNQKNHYIRRSFLC